jgi:hypothetical protein
MRVDPCTGRLIVRPEISLATGTSRDGTRAAEQRRNGGTHDSDGTGALMSVAKLSLVTRVLAAGLVAACAAPRDPAPVPDARAIADAGVDGSAEDGSADGRSDGWPSDGGAAGEPAPASLCGDGDREITSISTAWGPAWSPPDPSAIDDGWPVHARYELWWIPMPEGTLAYRITVPADFDATLDPAAFGQIGYVRTAESPSTPVVSYDFALSETACDLEHGVVARSSRPPYAELGQTAADTNTNSIDLHFQVRPPGLDHCVPVDGVERVFCLEPGRTYWWNLRLHAGCLDGEPSRCQPMIHVMRPRQAVDPEY